MMTDARRQDDLIAALHLKLLFKSAQLECKGERPSRSRCSSSSRPRKPGSSRSVADPAALTRMPMEIAELADGMWQRALKLTGQAATYDDKAARQRLERIQLENDVKAQSFSTPRAGSAVSAGGHGDFANRI